MAVSETDFIEISGGVCAAGGFAASGIRCGIKRKRRDIALLCCTTGDAVCAGVFTQNIVRAPCVLRNEKLLGAGSAVRAVIVNSGNANAGNGIGNGTAGWENNQSMAALAADALGVPAEKVLTASTGIIGTPLPMPLIRAGVAEAGTSIAASREGAAHAAEAILTTDTFPKEYAVEFDLGGSRVRIGGMAKGSGMIAPNMATMLAFVTTDVAIHPHLLQTALRAAVHVSFNALTVDGDTSTNDMCLVLASGTAGNTEIVDADSAEYAGFAENLTRVCVHLAKEVARDGEGATKLVTIRVTNAATESDARRVARTVAESPLVKTALFGNDPNWGRLLMAAGRAGVPFDPDSIRITLAGSLLFAHGVPAAFDAAALHDAMAAKEIEIAFDLGRAGGASTTFYTCDFSYDYVRINAEYHT